MQKRGKMTKIIIALEAGLTARKKGFGKCFQALAKPPVDGSGDLRTAAKALGATANFELGPIRESLQHWADALYKKAQAEIAAMRSE
jgi:hypothetical protein